MKSEKFSKLPSHIAFIMDGNGRWAKKRGLSRKFGHAQGVKTLEKILTELFDLHIPFVTVFAFSTENWNRSADEVDALMNLFRQYFQTHFKKLSDSGVNVNVIGDVTAFPEDLQEQIIRLSTVKHENCTGTLNIAMNYGSRSEIVRAVNAAVSRGQTVTQESFKDLLYTAGIPDPDLIVRTSGECRLSNFLLYQSAYSELYFCKKLWPDFTKRELYKALKNYAARNRRFGK